MKQVVYHTQHPKTEIVRAGYVINYSALIITIFSLTHFSLVFCEQLLANFHFVIVQMFVS